jgi:hypothetical protein
MFRTRRIIYQGTSRPRERPTDGQRLRKARSNDRWAADLATVASVEEAAASWKRSWEGGNRWKLQRTIDFSGGKEYGGHSVSGTPEKVAGHPEDRAQRDQLVLGERARNQ